MRIVVTGGRDFSDSREVEAKLGAIHRKHGICCLIEGGARGADRLCRQWAESNGVRVETHEADWSLGKMAGHSRNQRMINEGRPDAAVSFRGGRGTADMVARIKTAGIPLWAGHE